ETVAQGRIAELTRAGLNGDILPLAQIVSFTADIPLVGAQVALGSGELIAEADRLPDRGEHSRARKRQCGCQPGGRKPAASLGRQRSNHAGAEHEPAEHAADMGRIVDAWRE